MFRHVLYDFIDLLGKYYDLSEIVILCHLTATLHGMPHRSAQPERKQLTQM